MDYQYLVEYISQRAGDDDFSYECASRMMDIVEDSRIADMLGFAHDAGRVRSSIKHMPGSVSDDAEVEKFIKSHGNKINRLAKLVDSFNAAPPTPRDIIEASVIALYLTVYLVGGMYLLGVHISAPIIAVLALVSTAIYAIVPLTLKYNMADARKNLLAIRTRFERLNRKKLSPEVVKKIDDIVATIDDAESSWTSESVDFWDF